MFYDEQGNEMKTSGRYHHPGTESHIGEEINRREHAAKVKARVPISTRLYSKVTGGGRVLPDEAALNAKQEQDNMLKAGGYALNRKCETGARVKSEKLHAGYAEYKFNGDHGFGHGRAGRVEVVDDRTVRVHE